MVSHWKESFPIIDREAVSLGFRQGFDLREGSLRHTDKRFIVYVKGFYPGAHKSGYALRSRVVWWLYTGEILVGDEFDLHHKNRNRADDRFSNLEKLEHGAHSKEHNPSTVKILSFVCERCGKGYELKEWRAKWRETSFCSKSCFMKSYHEKKRNWIKCKWCGESFTAPANRCRQFCGNRCAIKFRWNGAKAS